MGFWAKSGAIILGGFFEAISLSNDTTNMPKSHVPITRFSVLFQGFLANGLLNFSSIQKNYDQHCSSIPSHIIAAQLSCQLAATIVYVFCQLITIIIMIVKYGSAEVWVR